MGEHDISAELIFICFYLVRKDNNINLTNKKIKKNSFNIIVKLLAHYIIDVDDDGCWLLL